MHERTVNRMSERKRKKKREKERKKKGKILRKVEDNEVERGRNIRGWNNTAADGGGGKRRRGGERLLGEFNDPLKSVGESASKASSRSF